MKALEHAQKELSNYKSIPLSEDWISVKDGLPELFEQVIGGGWHHYPWLVEEKEWQFLFGMCYMIPNDDLEEFPHGKMWATFGPSHNEITHWKRINPPKRGS